MFVHSRPHHTERGKAEKSFEVLQEVVEGTKKNNPRISASSDSQVNHLRTYPGMPHPHFIPVF
jgi:hypothetical protein|tara:strand:- start:33 stop:221 length:189 start_codon:yes stop_codon:yes gene_type:complete